jgi:hypothetical protein
MIDENTLGELRHNPPDEDSSVTFVRASRLRGRAPRPKRGAVFEIDDGSSSVKKGPSPQLVRAGYRKQYIHVVNRPARFPPVPMWPIEMRADLVAAYLDFRTTYVLCKAIAAGDAPRPTGTRGTGSAMEPVWFRDAVKEFAARRNASRHDPDREDK